MIHSYTVSKIMTHMPVDHRFRWSAAWGELRLPLFLAPLAKGRSCFCISSLPILATVVEFTFVSIAFVAIAFRSLVSLESGTERGHYPEQVWKRVLRAVFSRLHECAVALRG